MGVVSAGVGSSAVNVGRLGRSGCAYMIGENGRHIYVAFNCDYYTDYGSSGIRVNSEAIPSAYRPRNKVHTVCLTSDGSPVAAVVHPTGEVTIEAISSSNTAGDRMLWIDGYVDYWI